MNLLYITVPVRPLGHCKFRNSLNTCRLGVGTVDPMRIKSSHTIKKNKGKASFCAGALQQGFQIIGGKALKAAVYFVARLNSHYIVHLPSPEPLPQSRKCSLETKVGKNFVPVKVYRRGFSDQR